MIFWVEEARRSLFGLFTGLSSQSKLFATKLLTRGTHDGSVMEPIVLENSDGDFLPRMEALECVVRDVNVQSPILAGIVVASRAPVLPFACLLARSLFPHLFRVLETLRLRTILFQRKVFLAMWIVFLKLTLRTTHNNVFASPRELLNVWTVIGE